MFSEAGVALTQKDAAYLKAFSRGHAATLQCALRYMESGERLGEQLLSKVRLDLFHYSEQRCWDQWDIQIQETLLALASYDTFTSELAQAVTGRKQVEQILEDARNIGNFLIHHRDGTWELRGVLQKFLQWKQSLQYTAEDYCENFRAAASYYERMDETEMALIYYERAKDHHKISQLLLRNAQKHPGLAHFFETRRFYLALPEEEIRSSAALMSGMSMLYSLMMQPEESERWYRELLEYSRQKHLSRAEQREAKGRLIYLEIGLPHRSVNTVADIMRRSAVLVFNREIRLPEFSVTGNCPSVMNGGKDFSSWSPIDTELAVIMKKPVEAILGKYSKGLVNIALAESGFEKMTMSDYEVQTRLNTGYMMAEAGGRIEICFAATGTLIRLHISQGQMEVAQSTLESFLRKAEGENAQQLCPNLEALQVWMRLRLGDRECARKYLLTAPDEKQAFCILDRYRYMQKIRCLMTLERYGEAAGLIEWMHIYFTKYERQMYWMENQLLKAILLYRTDGNWEPVLAEAMKKCEHYHFVRVAAQEGAALLPLLESWDWEGMDSEYRRIVEQETERMADFYPEYLKAEQQRTKLLTAKESQIMKLYCGGATSEQICRECQITYNSLKFHNKNIYRKLGVRTRQEAVRKAVRMDL